MSTNGVTIIVVAAIYLISNLSMLAIGVYLGSLVEVARQMAQSHFQVDEPTYEQIGVMLHRLFAQRGVK